MPLARARKYSQQLARIGCSAQFAPDIWALVNKLFFFCLFLNTMIFKCVLQLCILLAATFAQVHHVAVLENEAYEQTLSNEFRNPFYKTARVREALKESSWLRPGEELVYERQAEKIPRSEIYSVLSHAGLIPRRKIQIRN